MLACLLTVSGVCCLSQNRLYPFPVILLNPLVALLLGLDQTAWFELTVDLFIMFNTCYKDYCAFKANFSHVPELNSTDEADRNVMN